MPAFLLSLIVSLAAASGAAAAPADFRPPVYTRLPTLDELVQFYPSGAMSAGLEATVMLNCVAGLSGRLEGCAVVSETVPDQGFGAAALAIASGIELTPARRDGVPVPLPVKIPIGFKLPGGGLPGWDETVRCYGLLSAHARAAPDDRRIAQGVEAAKAHAADLRKAQKRTRAFMDAALAEAAASTPPPAHPGATRDRCFMAFL